ncbi:hypothetical protein OUZ56_010411 [Daphnia magna]|uniref:Uncharacterized protein n=1 Tax=Daphnia magna TaxID=35525 RepID=A0ABR0AIG6_9CRUS|nr:hypothetical protein OUZ56_010411 [Daphnia magna]
MTAGPSRSRRKRKDNPQGSATGHQPSRCSSQAPKQRRKSTAAWTGEDLIQVVIVEDWNQRAMIGDKLEGGQAFEKLVAFTHCPSCRQAFQLDHCVTGFCIRQEAGSCLHDIPASIGVLLTEDETEASEAGRIDVKRGWGSRVVKR